MDNVAHQVGWATTKIGRNKYHFYQANGESLCNYERQPGELHFALRSNLFEKELCEACSHPRHDKIQKRLLQEAVPVLVGRYILDVPRFEQLVREHAGLVVLEHEDLMASPQYDQLKPWLVPDTSRGWGMHMLPLAEEDGTTSGKLWMLFCQKVIHFARMPQLRIGSLRVPCGKEVASA
jgi:hypothetical protein